jgi:RND family efflux transporter MFP subunit
LTAESADGALWLTIDGIRHRYLVAGIAAEIWIAGDGRTRMLEELLAEPVRPDDEHSGDAELLSPMPGSVVAVGVGDGDQIVAGTTVVAVEAMKMEHALRSPVDGVVELLVAVGDQVKVGQPLEFSTDALPGRTFTGKVMFINPAIDPASRSAKVVAEVPNRDGALKGGSFAKGRILVATRQGLLQVPREALLNWKVEEQTAEVWVVQGDKAEKRVVKTGLANHVTVEVVDGVKAGEQVVVRGGFQLREGDRVAVAKGEGA